MALNDVWRNINREIGVFWKGRFDRVPRLPGIYGWFYPLRITSTSLVDFIAEINKVLCFDAKLGGEPIQHLTASFTWDSVALTLAKQARPIHSSDDILRIWNQCMSNEILFQRLRETVMRASILMPPLYVGKAKQLDVRCGQHLSGTGSNDFHDRYQDFAAKVGVQARRVSDLLFVCITTGDDARDDRIEECVEEIVKHACKPTYSIR